MIIIKILCSLLLLSTNTTFCAEPSKEKQPDPVKVSATLVKDDKIRMVLIREIQLYVGSHFSGVGLGLSPIDYSQIKITNKLNTSDTFDENKNIYIPIEQYLQKKPITHIFIKKEDSDKCECKERCACAYKTFQVSPPIIINNDTNDIRTILLNALDLIKTIEDKHDYKFEASKLKKRIKKLEQTESKRKLLEQENERLKKENFIHKDFSKTFEEWTTKVDLVLNKQQNFDTTEEAISLEQSNDIFNTLEDKKKSLEQENLDLKSELDSKIKKLNSKEKLTEEKNIRKFKRRLNFIIYFLALFSSYVFYDWLCIQKNI